MTTRQANKQVRRELGFGLIEAERAAREKLRRDHFLGQIKAGEFRSTVDPNGFAGREAGATLQHLIGRERDS